MFLATLPEPSPSGDVLVSFLGILFEGAPYILIGTLISGFIDAFLPSRWLYRFMPSNKILATLVAGVLGFVFPVCECAVVPVVRRLVQKGLPLSCGLAYLLSAPVINVIVIGSTLNAFNEYNITSWSSLGDATMTLSRLSLSYVIAVLIGIVLIRVKPRSILNAAVADSMEREALTLDQPQRVLPFDVKITKAMRTAMRDFLETAMYFTIGIFLTSLFNTQVPQASIQGLAERDIFAIPAMMGLSFILALCSTSDAFIVAPMDVFSQASKLAFLVLGPMLDIKLIFMYTRVFRRRFILFLSLALFILVGVLSEPWMALISMLKSSPLP